MGRDHEPLVCLPCAMAFHAAFHTFSCRLSQGDIKAQSHGLDHPEHMAVDWGLAGSESPHLPFQAKLGISDPIPTHRVEEMGESGVSLAYLHGSSRSPL